MSKQVLENFFEKDLPKGWKSAKINDITNVIRGASPRPKGDPRYFGGNIPWIMIRDVSKEKGKFITKTRDTVTEEGAKKSRFLKKGSLILSNSGTVCVPKILGVDGCIHDGFVAFPMLPQNIEILYAYYWFEYIRPKIIQENRQGVTQVNLNTNIVRDIVIPIPPLNEQKRIVSKIEELFSEIDFQFQTTKQTKNLLKLNIKSLLKNAFNGNLTKTWRETHSPKKPKELLNKIEKERENSNLEKFDKNISSSYDFDNDWEVSSLGFITENHDGKRIPVSRVKRKEMTGNYPYYGASGIIDYVNRPLFKGRHLLIGEDGANLLARSTPIAFIADGEFWVNNHAHVLTTLGEIPLEFVSHFINSIDLSEWVTGTAQPKLNQRNMNKIPIPIPSVEEQIEIVKIIEQDLSLIDKQFELLKIWLISLSKLRIAILKQAFEGKLAPQDPNDDSAEILLQKIKQEKKILEQKQKIIKVKAPKRRRKNVK